MTTMTDAQHERAKFLLGRVAERVANVERWLRLGHDLEQRHIRDLEAASDGIAEVLHNEESDHACD